MVKKCLSKDELCSWASGREDHVSGFLSFYEAVVAAYQAHGSYDTFPCGGFVTFSYEIGEYGGTP